MPKVYLSTEKRECNQFSDFVRGELKRQKKQHADLAYELNLSRASVTNKINGKISWSLQEVIQTVHFLGQEYTFGRRK